MLKKPEIKDEKIITCLNMGYGLTAQQLTFLPLGADLNTAVYRAVTENETPYFVKLRKDNFDPTSVALPKFLSDLNISNIIPPLRTQTGQLWSTVESFNLILYPFIEGQNGFEIDLSDHDWFEFGQALKKIHGAEIPTAIKNQIQSEGYSSKWRESVKGYLERIQGESFKDPIACDLADFLISKRDEILDLLERTERLANQLQKDPPPHIVCHSDIHAGNILIDHQHNFYIVDWDNPILAPRERDLMFIGGAQGFRGHSLEEEENLFYKGYGSVEINQFALSYYRCERIIDDIAAYCDELFSEAGGEEDRRQSLQYLKSNFLPGGTIQTAYTKGIT
jgi:spectinomycin phosphotransferase